MYMGNTIKINDFMINNGIIFKKLDNDNSYYDTETNIFHQYETYIIELPSILDLCIITFYHEYHSVCRWDG